MRQFATCHSHPASLDSASTPLAMARREVELGSGVLTCTDHGTLAATQQIYEIAHSKKWPDGTSKPPLIPVIGLEGYFRDDNCPILGKLGVQRTTAIPRGMNRDEWMVTHPDGLSYVEYLKYMHVTLHFLDYDAYLCAVRILSRADKRAELHGQERKPMFSWEDLEELASHRVTATSSCLIGMVQRHLFHAKNPAAAGAYLDRMRHLFGDRFYVEVFPHVCSHNWVSKVVVTTEDSSGIAEETQFALKKKLRTSNNEPDGISAEALAEKWDFGSNPSHLVEIKNYRTWDALPEKKRIVSVKMKEGLFQNECTPAAPGGDVQWGTNIYVLEKAKKYNIPVLIADDSHFAYPEEKVVQDVRLAQGGGSWKFSNSYHRQSSDEAWSYFRDRLDIAPERFDGWVDNTQEWASRFTGFKMDTTISIPTKFYPSDSLAFTRELVEKHGRLLKSPEYLARLKSELKVLHRNGKMDWLPYFHIDEEVCRIYENQGWLTGPGRGSAAGLLICYLLGITHVDPLKYGLSQERFITEDRIASGKVPDIDQDLPDRDPLVGQEVPVVEFEAEDGTIHILPEDFKIETSQGLMTVSEVLASGADFKPWWLEKSL
jgi:DNA polymerase III alpha subunit